MKLSKFFCLLDHLGRKYSGGERVGTHELTPAEITYARACGVLDVEPDGCGTVPVKWIEALRRHRASEVRS
jgi:hypothetical protein